MAGKGRPSTKVYKSPDGKVINTCYCRRCQQDLSPRNFYEATDEILDTNGFMSVCKDCISDLFINYFKIENSLEKAILEVCRLMNVAYVPEAIESVRTWINKRMKDGSDYAGAFGFYKAKVGVFARMNPVQQKHFIEPSSDLFDDAVEDVGEENYDLVEFWGAGLTFDEYEFLEKELANFKKTHKSDTHSELVLLKEVCFVMLDISKARKSNKSTASLVKSLQEIMKSLAISPNMANASTASKSTEAFGLWIKDIEELEPAEWHEDNKIYKDMDNLDIYFQNYFVRPIRNFITGSRDFTLTETDGDVDLEISELDYDDYEED